MQKVKLFLTLLLFSTASLLAQEIEKDKKQNKSTIQNGTKGINSQQAVEGDVKFSDGTNQLLRITDEGNFGAIQMQDGIPSDVTNKLYNNAGTLNFNGTALGSGGATSLNDLSDAINDSSSVFIGNGSGINDDGSSNSNTALGFNTLFSNTTGDQNTAIGYNALSLNVTGTYNTAVGYSALVSNTNSYNTAIGYFSLYSNTSGTENTAIGSEALRDNTTGSSNIAIGETSLLNNTTGRNNTAIGDGALNNNMTGKNNTAIGFAAGRKVLGDGNVFIGYEAGFNETGSNKLYVESGFDDINNPLIYGNFADDSIKFNARAHVTTSLSVGDGAIAGTINSLAVGINSQAQGLTSVAIGEDNLAWGYKSAAFGHGVKAMAFASTAIGRYNVGDALESQTVWVDTDVLFEIGNGTDASNRSNAITVKKNGNTTINGNLDLNGRAAIGETATVSGTNSFAIGSNVNVTGNGTLFIGDNSATASQTANTDNRFTARFSGGYKFYTNSDLSLNFGAILDADQSSWSTISDSTKKENFLPVDGETVLHKISKFNLRSWNYIGQDPAKHRHYGPMAQEFFNAFGNDGIGIVGNDTTIASADIDGINLIAVQALEKRTAQQEQRIKNQEKRIEELEKQNKQLAKLNSEYRNEIEQIKQAITRIKKNQKEIKVTSN